MKDIKRLRLIILLILLGCQGRTNKGIENA